MEHATLRTVLLLGRPGSGKGTQTELLAKRLGWKTLSSGNTFRALRDSEGVLGARVRATYDAGLLFPHWFPTYLFQNSVLNMAPEEGIICEGFSRSLEQAESFHEVLSWLGRQYVVINLDVSEEEAMRRQLGRHKVDARPDSDSPEKIKVRFAEYTKLTEPVIAYFREKGTLIEVNGEQTPDQIAEEIFNTIKEQV